MKLCLGIVYAQSRQGTLRHNTTLQHQNTKLQHSNSTYCNKMIRLKYFIRFLVMCVVAQLGYEMGVWNYNFLHILAFATPFEWFVSLLDQHCKESLLKRMKSLMKRLSYNTQRLISLCRTPTKKRKTSFTLREITKEELRIRRIEKFCQGPTLV